MARACNGSMSCWHPNRGIRCAFAPASPRRPRRRRPRPPSPRLQHDRQQRPREAAHVPRGLQNVPRYPRRRSKRRPGNLYPPPNRCRDSIEARPRSSTNRSCLRSRKRRLRKQARPYRRGSSSRRRDRRNRHRRRHLRLQSRRRASPPPSCLRPRRSCGLRRNLSPHRPHRRSRRQPQRCPRHRP